MNPSEFPYDLTLTPDLWFMRVKALDGNFVRSKIQAFLDEDLPEGDATTLSTIDESTQSTAHVLAADPMVFAGAQVLPHIFTDACTVDLKVQDGDKVEAGTVLAELNGPAQELLARERVMLNLIQRLCGIATLTRKYADLPAPPGFKILDTRKTTPGLRIFEKYAVAVGGGYNHRLDLSSVVMVKDNHLVAAGGIAQALHKISTHWARDLFIELEVDNLEQLAEALLIGGVHAYLLDNMSPETIREAVQMVRSQPGGEQIFLEASGGMTYETLPNYLWSGVNGISIGGLTTRAQNVDIKLEFIA
jgi:nicotinate-nucleotide pyrophosphorylase (carboxylating)